jgi:hypothetical protein
MTITYRVHRPIRILLCESKSIILHIDLHLLFAIRRVILYIIINRIIIVL